MEIKQVDLDQLMVRAIARQAEAERERRAKVISAQAMYGMSQLGLRTTCRMVTRSLPGSKLAW